MKKTLKLLVLCTYFKITTHWICYKTYIQYMFVYFKWFNNAYGNTFHIMKNGILCISFKFEIYVLKFTYLS